MPDQLERQLAVFGRTLETVTAGPIVRDVQPDSAGAPRRPGRRWWAAAGAAATVVVLIAGLASLRRTDHDSNPVLGALLAECDAESLIQSSFDTDVTPHLDSSDAFKVAYGVIVSHAGPEAREVVPYDGWTQTTDGDLVTFYYETSAGRRAAIQITVDDDGYRPFRVEECVIEPSGSAIPILPTSAADSKPSSAATVEVPSVIGLTTSQAMSVLVEQGLQVAVVNVDIPAGDPLDGSVIEQSREAGDVVTVGKTVTVTVGVAAGSTG